jgi:repressor LexA
MDTSAQMGTQLTEAQEDILAFMVRHQETHARPPSLREICEEFGFASHNAARKHVQALARKNLVTQTGDGRTWAASNVKEVQGYLFRVPVYGTIPAGLPADNPELADETIRIDPAAYGLRSAKGLFALHVRGDSMVDAQIADGDLALLRNEPARPGAIVAALIDGESTLKRLVRERQRTFLRAENKRYRDLIPADTLTIQGVLVGVVGRGKR